MGPLATFGDAGWGLSPSPTVPWLLRGAPSPGWGLSPQPTHTHWPWWGWGSPGDPGQAGGSPQPWHMAGQGGEAEPAPRPPPSPPVLGGTPVRGHNTGGGHYRHSDGLPQPQKAPPKSCGAKPPGARGHNGDGCGGVGGRGGGGGRVPGHPRRIPAAAEAGAPRGGEHPKNAEKLSRPRPRTPRGTGTASAAAAPDRAGGRGAPPRAAAH